VPQYEVSADEPSLRSHGTFNLVNAVRFLMPSVLPNKFSECNSKSCFPSLDEWNAYTHGAWFEMFLSFLEIPLGFESLSTQGGENTHGIFLMRHFVTYFSWWIGIISIFYLIKREFQKKYLAWLAVLLSVSNPIIFGSAFNDTKNVVYASTVALALNFISKYCHSPSKYNAAVLGFVLGISAGRRIIGLVLLAIVLVYFLVSWKKLSLNSIKQAIKHNLVIAVSGLVALYVSMPYLWPNPALNLYKVIKGNSGFEFYNANVIVDGIWFNVKDIPSSYIFHWMLITIPLFLLALILLGTVTYLFQIFKGLFHKFGYSRMISLETSVYFILFCMVYMALLKPIMYGGWSHFFFFYPTFVFLSCLFISSLEDSLYANLNWKFAANFVSFLVVLFASPTLFWMAQNHPHQVYYSNILAGPREKFLEKWGYNGMGLDVHALRWILHNDSSEQILVDSINDSFLRLGTILLQPEEKNRICFVRYDDDCRGEVPNYVIDPKVPVGADRTGKLVKEYDLLNYTLVKRYTIDDAVFSEIYMKVVDVD
jgi:hypothetical protein